MEQSRGWLIVIVASWILNEHCNTIIQPNSLRRLNARFSELQPKFEVMFDKAMDQLYRSMVADAKTREEIEKGIASCQRYISLFEQAGRPIVDPGNEFIAKLKYYREALELLDSTEGSES